MPDGRRRRADRGARRPAAARRRGVGGRARRPAAAACCSSGPGNVYLQNALALLPNVELYGVTPERVGGDAPARTAFDLFVFDGFLPDRAARQARSWRSRRRARSPLGDVAGALTNPAVGQPSADEPLLRNVDLSRLHVARAQRMAAARLGTRRCCPARGDAPLIYSGARGRAADDGDRVRPAPERPAAPGGLADPGLATSPASCWASTTARCDPLAPGVAGRAAAATGRGRAAGDAARRVGPRAGAGRHGAARRPSSRRTQLGVYRVEEVARCGAPSRPRRAADATPSAAPVAGGRRAGAGAGRAGGRARPVRGGPVLDARSRTSRRVTAARLAALGGRRRHERRRPPAPPATSGGRSLVAARAGAADGRVAALRA